MSVHRAHPVLLTLFTAAAFLTLGRAPGAVQLKTRDLEIAIQGESRPGRDRRALIVWPTGGEADLGH